MDEDPQDSLNRGRRLFVGLMASQSLQEQIQSYQRTWRWPVSAKLTPVANFHLTLAFLGEVDDAAERALLVELGAVDFKPFALQLSKPGRFMPAGIAFVEPRPSDALSSLRAGVYRAVARTGLATQERWHPHVTLARKAGGVELPGTTPLISWAVKDFSLVVSSGGRYSPIRSWPPR
jgi:2'-5' RNA ligase